MGRCLECCRRCCACGRDHRVARVGSDSESPLLCYPSRQPLWLSEDELGVGVALRVGEPEVVGGGVGSVDRRGIDSVVVPVCGDEAVSGAAVDELVVGVAGRIRVAVVDETAGLPMKAGGVLSVAVEVPMAFQIANVFGVPLDEAFQYSTSEGE
jgi:hypothetical protein